MNKFEQLIEYVINDDEKNAEALFHEIVVEKSKDIYEEIMSEEDKVFKVETAVPELSKTCVKTCVSEPVEPAKDCHVATNPPPTKAAISMPLVGILLLLPSIFISLPILVPVGEIICP